MVRLPIKGGTILDISVLKGHDTANKIEAKLLDHHTAQISFDYLDHKEGGVLQIIHTGSEYSVDISKKLKGGCITNVSQTHFFSSCIKTLFSLFFAVFTLLSLETFNVFPESWYIQKEVLTLRDGYSLLFYGVFIIVLIGSLLFSLIKDFKEFIPKNCKK